MESSNEKNISIAFEIEIKNNNNGFSTPSKNQNIKQRLESRLNQSENNLNNENLSNSNNDVYEKLEKAKNKREMKKLAYKNSSEKKTK
jgi:hypothetical protein